MKQQAVQRRFFVLNFGMDCYSLRPLQLWAKVNSLTSGRFYWAALFMGVNFFLLGFGISMGFEAAGGQGPVRAGVSLLILKIIIFLGFLMLLFFRFEIDGLSFALGFSTLLLAVLVEAVTHSLK